MFLPILPPINTFLLFFKFLTTSSNPTLLNPIRLIIPESSTRRKSRFFGFPDWGLGVTVPISIKPKPKLLSSLYNSAFLSNPAAKPTGFLNLIPNNFFSNLESSNV